MRNYGYFNGGSGAHGHHWAMAVMCIVFAVVLLGALTIAILTLLLQKGHLQHAQVAPPGAPAPDALRVLDDRLARGEIDTDDYKARRDVLKGQ